MKYFKVFISILLICCLFSGCGFKFASSIDDLISPISPFGDNADIKKALDDFAEGGYSLRTPNSGEHMTSYSFYDLDGDGKEEAVAFYEPNDALGSIHMAVIRKTDGNWKVVENIRGDGTDIHSVEFCDITHDGKTELIVCWDVISNSTNHELYVYTFDEAQEEKLRKIGNSITVSNYLTVDLLGDGEPQLLLFAIDSGNSASAKAELYSYDDGDQQLLGDTKLDSHITSYEHIQTEVLDDDIRVYADALSSDGASMLTEIVYWSNSYNTIISPFYSYDTGITKDTARSALIHCMDIDGDQRLDVPLDYALDTLPEQVKCIDWRVYKNTILMHTAYSLFPQDGNYTLLIPNELMGRFKVEYDAAASEILLLNSNTSKLIFSVRSVLKAAYSEEKYQGYSLISEHGGYAYLAKVGNDEENKVSVSDIESYIKTIEDLPSSQEEL